jgi:ASC-1-like (ASCH) protein
MTVHKLKTWTEYFQAINRGDKTFELRVNDRDFQNGDILLLQEWNEDTGFTGNEITVVVTRPLAKVVAGIR